MTTVMEEDKESPAQPVPGTENKPFIPPPNLAPPPPPPPSPMDSLPRSTPPPVSGAGPVKLKSAGSLDADDDDAIPAGAVPFNTRIIAGVIDLVVATGLYITAIILLPGFIEGLVGYGLSLGYLLTRDSLPFLGGQSVGKKAMKIQAVTLEGKSLVNNWEPTLIRNLPLVIPLLGLVEVFILLSREEKPERGRRLGDEWGKTKVIFETKPVLVDDSEPPAVI